MLILLNSSKPKESVSEGAIVTLLIWFLKVTVVCLLIDILIKCCMCKA